MEDKLMQDAIEQFGWRTVYEVKTVVELSDPDGAYALFQDTGKDRFAECVEFLYFNN